MKKVLLVLPLSTLDWGTKNTGGVDSVAQMITEYLAERKNSNFFYRVLALDPMNSSVIQLDSLQLSETVEVVRFNMNETFGVFKLPSFMSVPCIIRQQVELFQPDIVHSHTNSWLIGVPSSSLRVATIHGYKKIARRRNGIINNILNEVALPFISKYFIDCYTCVGKELRDVVKKDVKKLVSLIHNPIDKDFYNIYERNRSNINLKLVTCSVLTRRKRIELIIKLAAELDERDIEFTLDIIGPFTESAYFSELNDLVEKLKLTKKIKFTGPYSKRQILNEYRCADIGIFLSKEETFGLAPLEMMAAGLPTLSTEVGIMSEKKELFYSPSVKLVNQKIDNISELANQLLSLVNKTDDNLIQVIRDNFSDESVVRSYENLYVKCLESGGVAGNYGRH